MCGIIGAINSTQAVQLVFEGLKKLEYRGYDSWGIAFKKHNSLETVKKVGKISSALLEKKIPSLEAIGHTRWATHGKVCLENTHPIFSLNKKISVVHNGIIENFQEIKSFLQGKGIIFETETDSEVIPQLIEFFCQKKNFEEAVFEAVKKLEGRYAFVAMHEDFNEIIGVKNGSPLIIGINKKQFFIASDIQAFPLKVRKAIYLEDNEMTSMNSKIKIIDLNSKKEVKVKKRIEEINRNNKSEENVFEHLMLKEIMDQKFSVFQAFKESKQEALKAAEIIKKAEKVFIIGAGTAHKVALLAQYIFSRFGGKECIACVSSEFENFAKFVNEKTIVIAVSQSGETADTLEAIEIAKSRGAKIVSIINAENTSMHRKSNIVIPVCAGIEKAVASTKSTTGQIIIAYVLAFLLSNSFEKNSKELEKALNDLSKLLSNNSFIEQIQTLAEKIKSKEKLFVLGRGMNYPIALEAAIKLQEVCYLPVIGFPGGEIKHGPLALIEEGIPCIVLLSEDETKNDTLSNANTVKSRGAKVICIGSENPGIGEFIQVPATEKFFPLMNLIPIQLLAYFVSIRKGINPDYPRNLAKSVTVK